MRHLSLALVLASTTSNAQIWVQQPDFPGSPRDNAAAFAIGPRVYVGTGRDTGSALTNDWYSFDGTTDQWSAIAPLPASPRQYCATFTCGYPDDGYGYLFSGIDANGPLNELWRYDPLTDGWTQMASLPAEPRYAAVAFNGGYVATGMFADGTTTQELWHYDPAMDNWTQLTSLPGPARYQACGSNWMGLMVVGGADSLDNALSDCWSYNSYTDTWSACASLPGGRYGALCNLVAYDFLLMGGASDDSTIVSSAFRFNQTEWLPMLDTFPGGTRMGGILIKTEGIPGWWHTYAGFGLSDDGERYGDWFRISAAFGTSEHQAGTLALHPNPSTERIWPKLPANWPTSIYLMHDMLGRCVLYGTINRGSPIDISALRPGHYDMVVKYHGGQLHAAVIKVP